MEGLLCDEMWLSSPSSSTTAASNCCAHIQSRNSNVQGYNIISNGSFYTTKEDCKQALSLCLEKELSYMPQKGYFEHLQSKELFLVRNKAIQWFIKSRSRLDLSFTTLFNAATYFDRFISISQCHGWKNWMVELLSVACLSVASKFNEISPLSLHELQMEDMDHTFESITIQRMELMLLQALGWRLGSTTAYEMLLMMVMMMSSDFLKSHRQKDLLVGRVTELLLGTTRDCDLVEHRPSVVAVSAMWCGLEELAPSKCKTHLAYITGFYDQDQKDEIVKCHNILEAKLANGLYNVVACGKSSCYPSSPVTVLLAERIGVYDGHVDLSLFKVASSNNNVESTQKKRKRETNQVEFD